MTYPLRSLLAIAFSTAVGCLVFQLIQARSDFLRGPVVIGLVTGHAVDRSASMKNRVHETIVSYQVPQTWPERAGQTLQHRFAETWRDQRPFGSEVQLRLSVRDPQQAAVNSLFGLWGLPLVVLLFGASLAMFLSAAASGPERNESLLPRRKARKTRPARPPGGAALSARNKLLTGLAAVIATGFFVYPPSMSLVLGPLFVLICGFALVRAALMLLRRLWRAFFVPAGNANGRGALGLAVDLLLPFNSVIVMGLFLILSAMVSLQAADKIFKSRAWAFGPLNALRSSLWLPQDFDEAACRSASAGNVLAARWLVENGARPEASCSGSKGGRPLALFVDNPQLLLPTQLNLPLQVAVKASDLANVQRMIASGADPNVYAADADPLLLEAAQQYDDALFKLLLDAGADPNLLLPDGSTITTRISKLDQRDRARDYLRQIADYGGDLDHRDAIGQTMLMRNSADPDSTSYALIELLLDLNVDPNLSSPDGRTALDMAMAMNFEEAVSALEARSARSGRLTQGPGVNALRPDSTPSQVALAQLERLRNEPITNWNPNVYSMGLSEYGASVLQSELPHADLQVSGHYTANQASATVCGKGSDGRSCVSMELRLEEIGAEMSADSDPTQRRWALRAYWRDYRAAITVF